MRLPLIRRRLVTEAPTGTERGATSPKTPREELVESIVVRERAALASLEVSTGGSALCSASSTARSASAVKYEEGAVCALAEARRAVRLVEEGPGATATAHAVISEIRARWRAQADTSGRTGPSWAGYLTGGLDALDRLVVDGGREGGGLR